MGGPARSVHVHIRIRAFGRTGMGRLVIRVAQLVEAGSFVLDGRGARNRLVRCHASLVDPFVDEWVLEGARLTLVQVRIDPAQPKQLLPEAILLEEEVVIHILDVDIRILPAGLVKQGLKDGRRAHPHGANSPGIPVQTVSTNGMEIYKGLLHADRRYDALKSAVNVAKEVLPCRSVDFHLRDCILQIRKVVLFHHLLILRFEDVIFMEVFLVVGRHFHDCRAPLNPAVSYHRRAPHKVFCKDLRFLAGLTPRGLVGGNIWLAGMDRAIRCTLPVRLVPRGPGL